MAARYVWVGVCVCVWVWVGARASHFGRAALFKMIIYISFSENINLTKDDLSALCGDIGRILMDGIRTARSLHSHRLPDTAWRCPLCNAGNQSINQSINQLINEVK